MASIRLGSRPRILLRRLVLHLDPFSLMDFCRSGEEESGKELGLENPVLFSFSDRIEDLAVRAGLFSSKTQARKNGYSGLIPTGYSEHGSRKNRSYVWNPTFGPDVYDFPGYDSYLLFEGLSQ